MNKRLHVFIVSPVLLFAIRAFSQSNSWQFTGGPFCGAAMSMVCNSSGHIFASTITGVFRSTDDGNSWTCVTQSMGVIGTNILMVKPDGTLFMGSSNGKVYRSTDNGDSWDLTLNGLPGNPITDLKCKGSDTLFAVTDSAGIYQSTNNGVLWNPANHGLASFVVNTLFIRKEGNIYTGTDKGAYVSRNNGVSWDTIPGMGTANVKVLVVNSKDKIYIYSEQRGTNAGIDFTFTSTDNGSTWTNQSVKLDSSYNAITHRWSYSTTLIYFDKIKTIDANDNLYFVNQNTHGSSVLYKASDIPITTSTTLLPYNTYGTIGQLIVYPSQNDSLYNGFVNSICFGMNGKLFIGTTEGGILRFPSSDSSAWNKVNRKLASKPVYCLLSKPNGKIFSMTLGGLFRLSQSTSSWEFINHYINTNSSSLALHPNGDIYLAYAPTIHSSDDGMHWDTCSALVHGSMTVAINSNGNITAGSYLSYLYHSTDNGLSWLSTTQSCSTLVAGNGGNIFGLCGNFIIRSTDYGATWQTLPNLTSYVSMMIYDPSAFPLFSFAEVNGNYIFGTYNGIVKSTNQGTTASYANQGLPLVVKESGWTVAGDSIFYFYDYPIIKTIVANVQGKIFIGCNAGVFCSTDNGNSWLEFAQGLPSTLSISSLAIDTSGVLYAGTEDGMVFRTTLTTVSVTVQTPTIPLAWKLVQNYPNPFNPSTRIEYQISQPTKVDLKIYDLLGREVASLVDEQKSTGHYEAQWDASRFAGGVYFATIRAGEFTKTIKLLLIK